MQHNISGFLVGLLFGTGLMVSGMTNPAKVQAFLDISGLWDPSLAMVMVGAISVVATAYYFAKKRTHTFLGDAMSLPAVKKIDASLIVGASLFGVGWGLAGFCPGPAIVTSFLGEGKALIFVIAMLIGMISVDLLRHVTKK